MLTIEQTKIIEKHSKSPEFVKAVIREYARDSINNIHDLLSFIPGLADMLLYTKHREVERYSLATDMMLAERYNNPIKDRKTRKGARVSEKFPNLFYTCRAHFPKGTADGMGEANKAFFNEFIDYLKNKRGFDYNNSDDWKWVAVVAGCGEWLANVIKTNIDATFEPPSIFY